MKATHIRTTLLLLLTLTATTVLRAQNPEATKQLYFTGQLLEEATRNNQLSKGYSEVVFEANSPDIVITSSEPTDHFIPGQRNSNGRYEYRVIMNRNASRSSNQRRTLFFSKEGININQEFVAPNVKELMSERYLITEKDDYITSLDITPRICAHLVQGEGCLELQTLLDLKIESLDGVALNKEVTTNSANAKVIKLSFKVADLKPTSAVRITTNSSNSVDIPIGGIGDRLRKIYNISSQLRSNTDASNSNTPRQYIVIGVSPANARVYINDVNVPVVSGVASKLLPLGNYSYRVELEGHESQSGVIYLNDPDSRIEKNVYLMANIGEIIIKGRNTNGAVVIIDSTVVGILPMNKIPVVVGNHHIIVAREGFKSYETTCSVEISKPFEINADLRVGQTSEMAHITFISDQNVAIWINGKMRGKGKVSDDFVQGNYLVETRSSGLTLESRFLYIPHAMVPRTIRLDVPEESTGNIEITSEPNGADVYFDGEYMGRTPTSLQQIDAGSHSLRLTTSDGGYWEETVELNGGQNLNINAKMLHNVVVSFSCNVADAMLYVDGKEQGNPQGNFDIALGSHNIFVQREGFADYEQRIEVKHEGQTFTIQMHPTFDRMITVNGISFQMIFVKGGNFTMGGTKGQGSAANGDEKPAHAVQLSDYLIGQTEVTQELYQAVVGNNPSINKNPKAPVENITYSDAVAFVQQLNVISGYSFRLPTEAEWEYAARGGVQGGDLRYSGSKDYDKCAVTGGSVNQPIDVGTRLSNELGIFDMSGNVWEWCSDYYHKNYYKKSPLLDPQGPETGSDRVIRGGAYDSDPEACRVSARMSHPCTMMGRSANLGFRLVLSK